MRTLAASPCTCLVDSTGLKLCGNGEWLLEEHGTATRRSWCLLHLGVDADTGRIVAATLTPKDVNDASQAAPLLDQVAGAVASFTGDGACDQDGVSAAVAERCPEAAIIVPPRPTAVPSETAETAPTHRDHHLQSIAKYGRAVWQKASGYTKRSRVEAAISRFKQVIGDGRSRSRFRVRSTRNAGGGCARAWRGSGHRGGRRCPCPQPHAGAWTPDLRPQCLILRRGWGNCAQTSDPCNTAAHQLVVVAVRAFDDAPGRHAALASDRSGFARFSPQPAGPFPSPHRVPARSSRCPPGRHGPANPHARTTRTRRLRSTPESGDRRRMASKCPFPAAHSIGSPCAGRRTSRPSSPTTRPANARRRREHDYSQRHSVTADQHHAGRDAAVSTRR